MRQAEHSASRSPARESGIREFRVMIVSAASFGTPRSHSLIGGTIRPSSNALRAWLGIEPGTAPPMSSWWPNAGTNATTSPPWNTGTVTHRSGRCPMPPSDRYTSLWKNTSPGRIVSSGKSRTTGWTSAEYDRPVSLRRRRSWMPARKSCASRIIGERAVRAMAVSTSRSTDASVSSTISRRIGSVTVFMAVSKASLRSALTAALRAGVRGDDEVAVAVEFRGEARVQRDRRAELLDDGGALDRVAGGEPLPPVDGRVLPAVEVDGPRAGAGARRVAVPLRALRQAGPGDRADAGDAQVDPLDGVARVVAVAVAVERLVGVVEAADDLGAERVVRLARGRGYPHLERLSVVPKVRRAGDAALAGAEALEGEGAHGLLLQVGVDAGEQRGVELRVADDAGADVVVLHVHREQPERRQVAGVLRDHGGGHAEDVEQPARQQRPGAAERDEGIVADVQAPLHRDLPDRVGLVPRRDLQHARGGPLRRQAELLGEGVDARGRGVHVEGDLAAEQVRRDAAEDGVGVGDRDLGAAASVAERAGVGAGAAGADLQRALRRPPRDRAAARPDGHDVDHRDLDGVAADRALGGEGRLPVQDDRDVGGGAAAVQRDDGAVPAVRDDERRAERARRRAGQHGRDRLPGDLLRRQHSPVALHH